MAKQIIVNVVLSADGTLDKAETDKAYFTLRDQLAATVQEDFDSVSVEITEFLLLNPGLRTLPTNSLVRGLWEARIESGLLKGKTKGEKDALFERLETIVPEYVKSNPDMFHMGRKTGIAVYFVPGEYVKTAAGETDFDPEGNPKQAYRHTPEEWNKLTTPKASTANGAASTSSAPASA